MYNLTGFLPITRNSVTDFSVSSRFFSLQIIKNELNSVAANNKMNTSDRLIIKMKNIVVFHDMSLHVQLSTLHFQLLVYLYSKHVQEQIETYYGNV